MFKILEKRMLAPQIYLMEIEAPRLAAAALPGQFLIIRDDERGSATRSPSATPTLSKGP